MTLSVAFSGDEKTLATGSYSNTARLWDLDTGEQKQEFKFDENETNVHFVATNDQGRHLFTTSHGKPTSIWDIATGEKLCQLISFEKSGDWLVVTRDGRFDGSPGAMQHLFFRSPNLKALTPIDQYEGDRTQGLLSLILKDKASKLEVPAGVSPSVGDLK